MLTVMALVGYALSVITYFLFVPEALQHWQTVVGMLLVSIGYLMLLCSKLYKLITDVDKQKDENEKKKEKYINNILVIVGYVILFTFFTLIHLSEKFTFHLRFYDIFAAVGYFMAIFAKINIIPLWVAFVPLVVYYFMGGSFKIGEKSIIERVQMVARFILAAYYGLSLIP
jgi:hypothetical protein